MGTNDPGSEVTDTFNVVIVGYGPVGEYLALKLADAGHTVACIEKWPTPYPRPRAVHFDHEIARLLKTVGLDSRANPIIEHYDDVYRWVNADKEVLLDVNWGGVGPSGWNAANFFHQPELERELDSYVAQRPSIQVFRGLEVTGLDEDETGVTVTAQSRDGEQAERSFRGSYVVGADGANSFVRRWMNAEMHDLGFEYDWLIVDMIPHEPMTFEPPAWQWCNPAAPTTIVPGGPGRRRWEFMRLPHETLAELNTEQTAWERMADWGLTPENSTLERHTVYTFKAMWAEPEQWRKGRVLIAGDAAHLTPPFAGQGMCAGLRDAQNISWKLDAVLTGRAPQDLLDTYGPERSNNMRYWIDFAVSLGEIICVLDPAAAAARDEAMKAAVADPSLAPPAPPPPSLTTGIIGHHPAAGHLSHQYRVSNGDGADFFDHVAGYGWAVISTAPDPAQHLDADTRDWAERNGFVLAGVRAGDAADANGGNRHELQDVDGNYAAWLGELGADSVIVRPDFYIYDVVDHADLNAALGRLRTAIEGGASARTPGIRDIAHTNSSSDVSR